MSVVLEFKLDTPIKIPVDSGHFRVFVPFSCKVGNSDVSANYSQSEPIPAQEHTSELTTPADDVDLVKLQEICLGRSEKWRVVEAHPWILYRLYSMRQLSQPERVGIMLCIDSSICLIGKSCSLGENDASLDLKVLMKLDLEVDLGSSIPGNFGKLILDIEWLTDHTHLKGYVPVNLIVDFGNTRTIAMLASRNGSNVRMEPVFFPPRELDFEQDLNCESDQKYQIIDSWLLLQEPSFQSTQDSYREVSGGLNTTRAYFAELSPSYLGCGIDALQTLAEVPQTGHRNSVFMSSPKRLLWCHYPHETLALWRVLVRDGNISNVRLLDDQSQKYLSDADRKLLGGFNTCDDLSTEPTTAVTKAMSVYWIALRILERAHQQLMHSRQLGRHDARYELGNVHGTFPKTWTRAEKDNYRNAWECAIRAFKSARGITRQAMDFKLELNEAVAAQIPYVYSETYNLKRLRDWLRVFGKDNDGIREVVVLNVDIGGGTTDFASIVYRESDGKRDTKVEFSYSNQYAGDTIVREVVKRLIPQLAQKVDKPQSISIDTLSQSLYEPAGDLSGIMSDVTNCILVPWVYEFFEQLKVDSPKDLSTKELESKNLIKLNNLFRAIYRKFGERVDSDPWGNPVITLLRSDLLETIQSSLEALVEHVGILAATVDCDIVFFSGKVSELPVIKNLLRESVALPNSRIIFSDEYTFVNWSPYKGVGGITDAKCVTVLGCALSALGFFPFKEETSSGNDYEWRLCHPDGPHQDITLGEADVVTIMMKQGSRLKRRLTADLDFEPVYRLIALVGEDDKLADYDTEFAVQISRNPENPSELSASPVGGGSEGWGVEVIVDTLSEEAFWKDAPRF